MEERVEEYKAALSQALTDLQNMRCALYISLLTV